MMLGAERKLKEADFLVRLDLAKCLLDKKQRKIPAEFLATARIAIYEAIEAIQDYEEATNHERD